MMNKNTARCNQILEFSKIFSSLKEYFFTDGISFPQASAVSRNGCLYTKFCQIAVNLFFFLFLCYKMRMSFPKQTGLFPLRFFQKIRTFRKNFPIRTEPNNAFPNLLLRFFWKKVLPILLKSIFSHRAYFHRRSEHLL